MEKLVLYDLLDCRIPIPPFLSVSRESGIFHFDDRH